jgi:hypothetical protein
MIRSIFVLFLYFLSAVCQAPPRALRACALRPSWVVDKAVSCRDAVAYVKEGTGLVLSCPFGANVTHGLVVKSDSFFLAGPFKTGRLAVTDFVAPPGSPLGGQPFVAFRAATPTGVRMEGRMQNGASRFVSATFSKDKEPAFLREDMRAILDDDRIVNVTLSRGEIDGQPVAARINVDSRTEALQLDKQTWSSESFEVSVHLGVDGGAVFSELSAVVIAFGDNDGGQSASLAGALGCAYGETTFPPTQPPTPAPTPAPTVGGVMQTTFSRTSSASGSVSLHPAPTQSSTATSIIEKTTTVETSVSSAAYITSVSNVGNTESTQNSALLATSTSALLTTALGASAVTASAEYTATDVPLIAGAAAAGAVALLAMVGVAVAIGKRCRRRSAPNSEVPMASSDGAVPNESPAPQRTSEYGLMSAAAPRGEYASMRADGRDVPMAASNYGAAPPAKDAHDEHTADSHYTKSAIDFVVKNDVSAYGAF